ncbi:MAG TPA: NFACT RNA binding domain-containing protein [Candidatus Nanoarchaeia archaeon]|nr:NFACT RNA binding domain-containing protein [Candidatus Nanoarchaeia archaeon]
MEKTKEIKFRKFCISSGKEILCGKNAEQNELIVSQSEDEETVLHTKSPGSPFCNIKGRAVKKDIEEGAIVCAAFSKDWKQNKSNVEIHVFKGKNIFKDAEMKTGTFGVKNIKSLIVKKEDILKFIKNEENN